VTVAGTDGGIETDSSGCGSGGGGGGAGGSVVVIATEIDVELGGIITKGGAGGNDPDNCGRPGGIGAPGRVFLVADTLTGSRLPDVAELGVCDEVGSCPMSARRFCSDIAQARPGTPNGQYWIDPDEIGPMRVQCDMTSDGGRGHTMIRVEDPALVGEQAIYARACQLWGMEIIVPRSREHAFAIQAWNEGEIPNLVNVFPHTTGEEGLSYWHASCRGSPCDFWLSDSDDVDCLESEFQPDGDNASHLRLYRVGPVCTHGVDYGRWNDNEVDTVAIQGWVLCSPNDNEG